MCLERFSGWSQEKLGDFPGNSGYRGGTRVPMQGGVNKMFGGGGVCVGGGGSWKL